MCEVLCLPRHLHMEVHKVLCLSRNLHFEVHKVLRLPRKMQVAMLRDFLPKCNLQRYEPKHFRDTSMQLADNARTMNWSYRSVVEP